MFLKQQATWKLVIPYHSSVCRNTKNCLTRCWSERFLSNFFYFLLFWQNTPVWLFSVCLKTRGSKKKAIQSGRQWYNLWKKGTCFTNKPTATTPLGSGFPPSVVLFSPYSYIHFSYCSECVPLDTIRVFSTSAHILVPSIKHFKLHQLTWEKWPTSSKACLNTWKITSCSKNP